MKSRVVDIGDRTSQRNATIEILEAAYRLSSGTTNEWLASVAAAALPWLDQGLGVGARLYRVTPAGLDVGTSETIGANPDLDAASRASMTNAAAISSDLFRATRVCTESELVANVGTARPIVEMVLAPMRTLGIRDTLTVQMCDTDGYGVILAAPLAHEATISPTMRRRLARLGTHLLTAARLRRALAKGTASVALERGATGYITVHDEAIQGPLRARVIAEASDIDRQRKTLRDDPERLLEIWRGLVAGTWSVLEEVTSAGSRYVVLRRNAPTTARSASTASLSERERQVAAYLVNGWANRSIAYALGVSTPTVATIVARLKRKFGVTSRIAIAAAYARQD